MYEFFFFCMKKIIFLINFCFVLLLALDNKQSFADEIAGTNSDVKNFIQEMENENNNIDEDVSKENVKKVIEKYEQEFLFDKNFQIGLYFKDHFNLLFDLGVLGGETLHDQGLFYGCFGNIGFLFKIDRYINIFIKLGINFEKYNWRDKSVANFLGDTFTDTLQLNWLNETKPDYLITNSNFYRLSLEIGNRFLVDNNLKANQKQYISVYFIASSLFCLSDKQDLRQHMILTPNGIYYNFFGSGQLDRAFGFGIDYIFNYNKFFEFFIGLRYIYSFAIVRSEKDYIVGIDMSNDADQELILNIDYNQYDNNSIMLRAGISFVI